MIRLAPGAKGGSQVQSFESASISTATLFGATLPYVLLYYGKLDLFDLECRSPLIRGGGRTEVQASISTAADSRASDISYHSHPHHPIIGQNGANLEEQFGGAPECYLGITIPNFPNFILFGGPLLAVANYTIQVIKKMQVENVRSLAPRQDVTDKFSAYVQESIKTSVWKEDCRSWYKGHDTREVFAVWSGSSLHYMQTLSVPRYEDYTITYHNENLWAHLGLGFTKGDRDPKASTAPYLNAEASHDRWMAQFGPAEPLKPERNGP